MRTRVKICGVTRAEDAACAARCGADAVGAVFIADSPREVRIGDAANLFEAVPPFVSRVGLFRDAEPDFVREIMALAGLSVLQFHGSESARECQAFALPYLRAVNGERRDAIADMQQRDPVALGYVLDSVARGEGGTGQVFNWDNWPGQCAKPLILAGGLHPHNVAMAIRRLRPWGVDVSTGVEDGIKGEKSHDKIRLFVQNAHNA